MRIQQHSLKILFVTHYAQMYGANRSLLSLIGGLSKKGFRPYVISPEHGPIIENLKEKKICTFVIPFRRWIHKQSGKSGFFSKIIFLPNSLLSSVNRWKKNGEVVKEIQKIVGRENIDLIYTNSAVMPIGAMVASKCNLPHIWHLREFGDRDFGLTWDFGHRFSRWYIGSKSDAVICVSEAVKNHFVQSSSKKKFHVVHNGVATKEEFSRFEEKFAVPANTYNKMFTFAIVGSIQPAKGQETAIRAIAAVQKQELGVKLIIAGGGNIEGLEKLVHELNIESHVEFTGHVDDPWMVYEKSDAVLMCSHSEGMGRVTVEAMVAKRPVIGYDNAGTSELIEDGETGFLYSGDHRELADQMMRLMNNEKEYKKLAENGFHFANSRFGVEHYVDQVSEIIHCLNNP